MKSRIHPSKWTPKFFGVIAAVLAAINLMGPNGFIHGLLLRQESQRLEATSKVLQAQIDAVKAQTFHFRSSKIAKEKAIREELGYLKPDEISVEISE